MTTIKIFLASSNELINDRERFELEINRKNKLWHNKGICFHLEIWEDLSTRMSLTRSQDEYNKKIKDSDLFVLLAYSKIGIYTAEEFETAFGAFQKNQKPFIFTYFKDICTKVEDSLDLFKNKLKDLGHFYASYKDSEHLWNQFNKELDRLLLDGFELNNQTQKNESIVVNNQGATIKNQINNSTFNNPIFK